MKLQDVLKEAFPDSVVDDQFENGLFSVESGSSRRVVKACKENVELLSWVVLKHVAVAFMFNSRDGVQGYIAVNRTPLRGCAVVMMQVHLEKIEKIIRDNGGTIAPYAQKDEEGKGRIIAEVQLQRWTYSSSYGESTGGPKVQVQLRQKGAKQYLWATNEWAYYNKDNLMKKVSSADMHIIEAVADAIPEKNHDEKMNVVRKEIGKARGYAEVRWYEGDVPEELRTFAKKLKLAKRL